MLCTREKGKAPVAPQVHDLDTFHVSDLGRHVRQFRTLHQRHRSSGTFMGPLKFGILECHDEIGKFLPATNSIDFKLAGGLATRHLRGCKLSMDSHNRKQRIGFATKLVGCHFHVLNFVKWNGDRHSASIKTYPLCRDSHMKIPRGLSATPRHALSRHAIHKKKQASRIDCNSGCGKDLSRLWIKHLMPIHKCGEMIASSFHGRIQILYYLQDEVQSVHKPRYFHQHCRNSSRVQVS